ncbi:beta-1,6-N-acetylglucosaminyltransferase [Siccibacter colletis]|uniref:beta-1,6-N-acetylglucosaminyltransferase n=1 Tax=Siccibacter colletis TaxID=1505757 RepID=UPI0004E22469|nr:beta-1,6-N-acetylglucosaminyltransferase [Siccibacter colletis]
MKTAVLIQAHKNECYIKSLAENNQGVRFYVHFDAKYPEKRNWLISQGLSNLKVIEDPVKVYWGGSSQVEATIRLLKSAYKDERNFFFHLISSECMVLKSFEDIEKEWMQYPDKQFIESHRDNKNEWRLRTRVPHSNTPFLRTFFGKCLNKCFKFKAFFYDSVSFGKENYYFGSQWFSVNRGFVHEVLDAYTTSGFFKKFHNITCADEHAFAIFSRTLYGKQENIVDCNNRYIKFSGKSSPDYIHKAMIEKLINQKKYWFARKIQEDKLKKYISNGSTQ